MRVFQCIHRYPPQIPAFEARHRDRLAALSFAELRARYLADGFSSVYVLEPAHEGRSDEVFFTIWDYPLLQRKWAQENGLRTTDLQEILLAQVEAVRPDVFYTHSPRYDQGFIRRLPARRDLIRACWDAIINPYPPTHEAYDLRFTLFEPYVRYWQQHGYPARLLPPAVVPAWEALDAGSRDLDVLFYGQLAQYFFTGRNALLVGLARWARERRLNLRLHLQREERPILDHPRLARLRPWIPRITVPLPRALRGRVQPPIYGQELFSTIARSKIVVNAFTDHNGLYKDNMRTYEAIGCGAFLIGEDGIYPEPLVPGEDLYTYRSLPELIDQIERVLALPDQGRTLALRTRDKLRRRCSKARQWQVFVESVQSLGR